MNHSASAAAYCKAREFLIAHSTDYETAYSGFSWPELDEFNWALEWFDEMAAGNGRIALWIVEQDGSELQVSFAEMSRRSSQVASYLRHLGVGRGDRILVVLGNQVELWETILAAMKLGAVIVPATPLLLANDIADRIHRGAVRHVIARSDVTSKLDHIDGDYSRIAVGDRVDRWHDYAEYRSWGKPFEVERPTQADETLLLYFTSGTTALPKLVEHTHASYPVGHLSTMYWMGLSEDDVHLNLSSPGWAKHAWSNVFAPWNAGATICVYNYVRFNADMLIAAMDRCGVTSFCAPPTVWRMMIQSDLTQLRNPPRKLVAAGEPLNPEVIDSVNRSWGVVIRDGFGQTETTVAIANTPGQVVKNGSMGRPVPGYRIVLIDETTGERADEGEICLDLAARPLGLMAGYHGEPDRTDEVMRGGVYHTGDLGSRDANGYITYVGRSDDVFKASDYRISPFELENVLLEHDAVAEAAVVPCPDPIRQAYPKAYIALADGWTPNRDTASSIFLHSRASLAPYKRIRRLEFADLPKTSSGKIRRVDLRQREINIANGDIPRGPADFGENDFSSHA